MAIFSDLGKLKSSEDIAAKKSANDKSSLMEKIKIPKLSHTSVSHVQTLFYMYIVHLPWFMREFVYVFVLKQHLW